MIGILWINFRFFYPPPYFLLVPIANASSYPEIFFIYVASEDQLLLNFIFDSVLHRDLRLNCDVSKNNDGEEC